VGSEIDQSAIHAARAIATPTDPCKTRRPHDPITDRVLQNTNVLTGSASTSSRSARYPGFPAQLTSAQHDFAAKLVGADRFEWRKAEHLTKCRGPRIGAIDSKAKP